MSYQNVNGDQLEVKKSTVQVVLSNEVGLASRTRFTDKKTEKRKILWLVNGRMPVIFGIIFAMIVVHTETVHSAA